MDYIHNTLDFIKGVLTIPNCFAFSVGIIGAISLKQIYDIRRNRRGDALKSISPDETPLVIGKRGYVIGEFDRERVIRESFGRYPSGVDEEDDRFERLLRHAVERGYIPEEDFERKRRQRNAPSPLARISDPSIEESG